MAIFTSSRLRRITLLAGLLLAGTLATHAQPGNGGSTGGPPQPADPIETPIDSGAALLLASGTAYALKRLRSNYPIKRLRHSRAQAVAKMTVARLRFGQ